MKHYLADSKTHDPIAGPFDSHDDAFEAAENRFHDDEWLDEQLDAEYPGKWLISGWKPITEWRVVPTDNPSRNPDTNWTLHNLFYGIGIFVENLDDGFYVGLTHEEGEDRGKLIDGIDCRDIGDVFVAVAHYVENHEEYHDYERVEVTMENASIDADLIPPAE